MTKEQIIKLYIADLNNLVADSDAKRSRIMDLEDELEALKQGQSLPIDSEDEVLSTLERKGRESISKTKITEHKKVDEVDMGLNEVLDINLIDEHITEAKYKGRTVTLNKPMRGDSKKFKVYVNSGKKNADGSIKVKKVNFGHGGTTAKKAGQKTMKIRKSNPKARSAFRARHNCDNPGPKTMARYWSCKKW